MLSFPTGMISQQKVYDTLTYHWQTGQQVREKIAEARGKKRWQINVGTIYAHLDTLVQNGFADMRERDPTQEEMNVRRGNKVSEYCKSGTKVPDYDIPTILPELVPT